MITLDVAHRRRAFRWLRMAVRRVSRWYAIACARDDAKRVGFVVPDRLYG